jgi:hypothetical protein
MIRGGIFTVNFSTKYVGFAEIFMATNLFIVDSFLNFQAYNLNYFKFSAECKIYLFHGINNTRLFCHLSEIISITLQISA